MTRRPAMPVLAVASRWCRRPSSGVAATPAPPIRLAVLAPVVVRAFERATPSSTVDNICVLYVCAIPPAAHVTSRVGGPVHARR